MRFDRVCWLAVCSGWACLAIPVAAQEDEAEANFGKGVHAYFEGRLDDAENYFTQAIGEETVDPRPYYFRGLTRQLLGHTGQGVDDLQRGAEIEASPRGRGFDVHSALERVQGPPRIRLEQIRREVSARLRPKLQKEADGMTHFVPPARKKPAQDGEAPAAGTLDPESLPDVSTLVDTTLPFPNTDAVARPPTIVDPSALPEAPETDVVEELPPAEKPGDKKDDSDPFGG